MGTSMVHTLPLNPISFLQLSYVHIPVYAEFLPTAPSGYSLHGSVYRICPDVTLIADSKFRLTAKLLLCPPASNTVLIKDIIVFTEDHFMVLKEVINKYQRNDSFIDLYDLRDNSQRKYNVVTRHPERKMILLKEGRYIATTDGSKISVIYFYLHWENQSYEVENIDEIYKRDEDAVSAIAACSHSILAVARYSSILLMATHDGAVYRVIEQPWGLYRLVSMVWCPPAFDMCSTTDDTLVVCDSYGLHKREPFTGSSTLIEVPQIKSAASVAAYLDGSFFACDQKDNKLYLIGRDCKRVQQVWSLADQLKSGDKLTHVSVNEKKRCTHRGVLKDNYFLAQLLSYFHVDVELSDLITD
ncbi:hypothetical protein RRG08_020698 [Elysia crispata]|uniref:Uncharacterized protein n=1 Tax=Elysia crispata TaxID=231223 RepID=A0AAE0ZLV5_9GAST|nr:hypothetical protein RRG08_020698 [Elysia crispata]